MKKWYKLDNVGKFYASTSNSIIPKVFRYSAYLYESINENILQIALNKTIKIFPNFNVNLKKGIFWYYLDETNKKNSSTNLRIVKLVLLFYLMFYYSIYLSISFTSVAISGLLT